MNSEKALELGTKTSFLMDQQALTGVYFDQEKAKALYEHCCKRMKELEDEIEPGLPKRNLNKGELDDVTPPKRIKKQGKDGFEPSSYYRKFADKMRSQYGVYVDLSDLEIEHKPLITKGKMQLKHQPALKKWLMEEHGWEPTLWNYKIGPDGKKVRTRKGYEKTTPKFHENGEICENLQKLGEVVSIIKPIIEWMSIRNRRSVLWNPEKNSGWIANPRLKKDGRISARASGLTYTMRQKHAGVANIPRITSPLGKEMRELFCAPEGKVLVGYDASSLEAYIKGHYAFDYPGGQEYYEKITDPNFDEHQETADAWGLASRQDAKAGNYGLQYNQQPPGLAATYKVSLAEGERRHALYWEKNKPYKMFLEDLEAHWEARGDDKVQCKTTGYLLHSRSKHSLGSLIIQHTGAIVMDISGIFMDWKLGGLKYDSNNLPYYLYKGHEVRRVIQYHDEYQWEASPEIAEEIGKLGVWSIAEAGKYYNLNVPLRAEYGVGKSWAETH